MVFAENRNAADGANTIFGAIRSFLNDHTVPYEKVAGLGSDGAAVMTGVRNGVGGHLCHNTGEKLQNYVQKLK